MKVTGAGRGGGALLTRGRAWRGSWALRARGENRHGGSLGCTLRGKDARGSETGRRQVGRAEHLQDRLLRSWTCLTTEARVGQGANARNVLRTAPGREEILLYVLTRIGKSG